MTAKSVLRGVLWLRLWGAVLSHQGKSLGWFATMLVAWDAFLEQAQTNRDNAAALLTLARSGGGPSDQLGAWYAEHDASCAFGVAKDIVVAAQASSGNARIGEQVPGWQGEVMTRALPGS